MLLLVEVEEEVVEVEVEGRTGAQPATSCAGAVLARPASFTCSLPLTRPADLTRHPPSQHTRHFGRSLSSLLLGADVSPKLTGPGPPSFSFAPSLHLRSTRTQLAPTSEADLNSSWLSVQRPNPLFSHQPFARARMPRATSQKFSSAAHQPAAGSSSSKAAAKTGGGGGEGGTNNPLFNTDKFGQHILKVRPSSWEECGAVAEVSMGERRWEGACC